MKIIQISDLHIKIGTPKKLVDILVREVNNQKAGAIVLTGDLVDEGRLDQYKSAAQILKRFHPTPMVVPGNHDARDGGLTLFEDFIGPTNFNKVVKGVQFYGLNSALPDLDEGMVGEIQHKNFCDIAMKEKREKVVLLHHHTMPVPNTGREKNMLFDAGEVLTACVDCDTRLILSGHRHQHHAWLVEKTVVVNAGTSLSEKLIQYNKHSYNIISFHHNRENDIKIELKDLTGKKTTLAHYDPSKLGICKLN